MSQNGHITAVVGLGTGRSATTRLAEFLRMQGGVIASHWSAQYVRWEPTEHEAGKILAWWEKELDEAAMAAASFRADVSPWHAPYVPHYLDALHSVKVVALYRDREATAESWARAISEYRFLRKADTSPRRCFPTFPTDTAYDAALKYWDAYQEKVNGLIKSYPETVRRFDIDALNTRQGQESILRFIGIEERRYPKDCTFHTVK